MKFPNVSTAQQPCYWYGSSRISTGRNNFTHPTFLNITLWKLLPAHVSDMYSLSYFRDSYEQISELTHLPLVLHICISELGPHWFRQWLVASSTTGHYRNKCWLIVNLSSGNTFQCNWIGITFPFLKMHLNFWSAKNGGHFVQGATSELPSSMTTGHCLWENCLSAYVDTHSGDIWTDRRVTLVTEQAMEMFLQVFVWS